MSPKHAALKIFGIALAAAGALGTVLSWKGGFSVGLVPVAMMLSGVGLLAISTAAKNP